MCDSEKSTFEEREAERLAIAIQEKLKREAHMRWEAFKDVGQFKAPAPLWTEPTGRRKR
jgi:hypothetical protein